MIVPLRAADVPEAGGKALGLARLLAADLPVPEGFCVLPGPVDDAALASALDALAADAVAVRSSAAGEDASGASFAGQLTTVLDVRGLAAVREAIERCRDASAGDYARARGLRAGAVAVVVQRMVHARASGVVFTRDPRDATRRVLLVEAVPGACEGLVSGRLTPERAEITDTLPPFTTVSAPELETLVTLARRAEARLGVALDVEWAVDDAGVWLLQARPITTGTERGEEIARLRALAHPRGTVWSRYGMAEVLPEPLPLTWSVIRRFMSADGGYGAMYRDLGYDPEPGTEVLDLVAGRPYVNLRRESRMYFQGFPMGYPFEDFRREPRRALHPRPEPRLDEAEAGFWKRLPGAALRMLRAEARVRAARADFERRFR